MFAFIPYSAPSEVLQPGKEPFDCPAFFVRSELSSILCFLLFAVAFVRRNQFNAFFFKLFVKRVAVIGPVTDQLSKRGLAETLFDGLFYQPRFKRCGGKNLDGKWPALLRSDGHDLGTLAPLGFAYARAPFFAEAKLPSINAVCFRLVCLL